MNWCRGNRVDTIECKSKLKKFEPNAVLAFRKKHPVGKNIVVTLDAAELQTIGKAGLEFTSIGVEYLGNYLSSGKQTRNRTLCYGIGRTAACASSTAAPGNKWDAL